MITTSTSLFAFPFSPPPLVPSPELERTSSLLRQCIIRSSYVLPTAGCSAKWYIAPLERRARYASAAARVRRWESEIEREGGKGWGRSGARRWRKDAWRVVREEGRVGGREWVGRRARRVVVRRVWRVSAVRGACLVGIFFLWMYH